MIFSSLLLAPLSFALLDPAALSTLPIALQRLQNLAPESLNPQYPPQFFPQLIDHHPLHSTPTSNDTFQQRYFIDTSNYVKGGPVFLLDGGETSGADRIPFLLKGILNILSKEHGGIGIILEHRYYGESFPLQNLTTENMQYLTSEQAVSDNIYFAQNLKLEGIDLDPKVTPWIIYGGSYAGAQAAFTRIRKNSPFWGAIASSAVTKSIYDFPEYYYPIREHANPVCIETLVKHVDDIDSVLNFNNTWSINKLKEYFGLNCSDTSFVNALSIPLGFFQAQNWDPEVGSSEFDRFCDALEVDSLDSAQKSTQHSLQHVFPGDPRNRFAGFAKYFKEVILPFCDSTQATQDECFSSAAKNVGMELADWRSRSWQYQVCTEWGFYQTAAPVGTPSLVSRLLDVEYSSQFCQDLFNITEPPNVERINKLGGFNVSYPRLAFIDGQFDPWLYATPHSPNSPFSHSDSLSRPFKLIPGGVHHYDENGTEGDSPRQIRQIHREEIEFVGSWLQEFEKRGRWKMGRDRDD